MKPMTIVKIVVAVVGLGTVGYFAYDAMQGRGHIDEYNRIVEEYYNEQEYEKAAEAFEDLLARADGELRKTVRDDLIQTYKDLGDDAGRSARESADWYRKAYRMDPDSLNEKQKKAMRVFEGRDDSDS